MTVRQTCMIHMCPRRSPGPQVSLKLPYSRYIEEPHSYMPITHHTIMNNDTAVYLSDSDSDGDGEESRSQRVELQALPKEKNGSLIRRLVVSDE